MDASGVSPSAGLSVAWTRPAVPLIRKEFEVLVLSRKQYESIQLGPDIVITVNEIRGDKVQLGIEAPKDVPVHRTEVYEAIKQSRITELRDRLDYEENQPDERDSERDCGIPNCPIPPITRAASDVDRGDGREGEA